MEKRDWEPLPPRKRRKQGIESLKEGKTLIQNDEQSNQHERGPTNAINDQIEENIRTRMMINHNITKLTSKDGVKGSHYEYLDHTADVQLHAWGDNMRHSFENVGVCMMNYMTDLENVDIDPEELHSITVTGTDLQALLYNYLNELLFKFISDTFCTKKITIKEMTHAEGVYSLKAALHGEIFDLGKHTSGTEVKAITYSAMQIVETEDKVDLFVIVDI